MAAWQRVSGKAFLGLTDHPVYNNPAQWRFSAAWSYVCHAGNYWFCIDRVEFNPIPSASYDDRRHTMVRISSTAEGPWSVMTGWPLPESYATGPDSSQYVPDYTYGIQYDGTYYYVLVVEGTGSGGGSGSTSGSYVYYTTNPMGSWSKFEINKIIISPAPSYYPSNAHYFSFIRHIDGYWVIGGTSYAGTYFTAPNSGSGWDHPAVIGYHTGSSPANAFTMTLDPAVTGYNIADLTLPNNSQGHDIEQIFKMDGHYLSLARADSTQYRACTRVSTVSPVGPWTVDGNYAVPMDVSGAKIHSNGILTAGVWNEPYPIRFRTSYNGAWQDSTAHYYPPGNQSTETAAIAYTDGMWMTAGNYEYNWDRGISEEAPRVMASPSLTGTWTEQHTRFYYPDAWSIQIYSIDGHGGKFVSVSDNQGELRYTTVAGG